MDAKLLKQPFDICGELLNGDGTIACLGSSMTPEIWQNDAVLLRQHLGYRDPEGVMDRSRMEEDNVLSFPHNLCEKACSV
jgi:hypothetical protein